MCGIVGYIGQLDAKEVLLKGLEKLEYRGYDSAGIAVRNADGIHVFKEKGRIADLRQVVDSSVVASTGIGHTRWATHGVPNYVNAHPHQSTSARFTIVHNGVIENYHLLQEEYLPHVEMQSDTDTEVIVQLVEHFSNEGMATEEAFRHTLSLLEGSYAIGLLDTQTDDTIFVAKKNSPLLVGVGAEFNVIASDAMAMLSVTDQFIELHDKEIVIAKADSIQIKKLDGTKVERAPYTAELDLSDIEKGTYPHYMLKEMDEQPAVVRRITQQYEDAAGNVTISEDIATAIKEADRLYIIAAGTSYHAGLIGKQYFEKIAKIPVEVHISSEFGYNMPLLSKNPLFVFISQSGETADSRQVLVKIKEMGYKALTITNVPGSTLSREANYTLPLYAGPEIAVASTKAYVAQITVLAITAYAVAEATDFDLKKELSIAANAIQTVIDHKEEFQALTEQFLATTRNAFFIGRGMDYFVSMEGALKLKEISYIQAEGFAGGELKHGTIALIEDGTPVIALATQKDVALNIRGNVKEVVARGANPCIISMEGMEEAGDAFTIPHVYPLLAPLASVVTVQLISYYAALYRGCDVDKPRNLAKSVTVE
ncbi:MAG: glutamine--fructose-6-phosphate transaminase (isomerizing) [Kurthia sp.]|nr:glutamine--fructose-6-phosphate transaminase (isomerizing) [Candidatus Kurthia equi]